MCESVCLWLVHAVGYCGNASLFDYESPIITLPLKERPCRHSTCCYVIVSDRQQPSWHAPVPPPVSSVHCRQPRRRRHTAPRSRSGPPEGDIEGCSVPQGSL